jgi:hypothetical protein
MGIFFGNKIIEVFISTVITPASKADGGVLFVLSVW